MNKNVLKGFLLIVCKEYTLWEDLQTFLVETISHFWLGSEGLTHD